jgi:hypothetical protein
MFARAHDFPKFVTVAAAMEHELRKVGARPRREILDIVVILREMIRSKQIAGKRQHKAAVMVEPNFSRVAEKAYSLSMS